MINKKLKIVILICYNLFVFSSYFWINAIFENFFADIAIIHSLILLFMAIAITIEIFVISYLKNKNSIEEIRNEQSVFVDKEFIISSIKEDPEIMGQLLELVKNDEEVKEILESNSVTDINEESEIDLEKEQKIEEKIAKEIKCEEIEKMMEELKTEESHTTFQVSNVEELTEKIKQETNQEECEESLIKEDKKELKEFPNLLGVFSPIKKEKKEKKEKSENEIDTEDIVNDIIKDL